MATVAPSLDVRPYDFRAAPRLGVPETAALAAQQAEFADALQPIWGARLRRPVKLQAGAASPLSHAEYLQAVSNATPRFLGAVGGTAGVAVLLVLTPELAVFAVDRLMGGPGNAAATPRPLTPLEQTVLGDLLQRALVPLGTALAIAPGAAAAGSVIMVTDDTAPPIVASDESVLALPFDVECGDVTGRLTVMVARHAVHKAPAGITSAPQSAAQARELIERHLVSAQVPVMACIGFQWAAARLAGMRPGQVLDTGHASRGAVEVHVNGRPLCAGMLGRQNGHVGVRVSHPIAPDTSEPPVLRRKRAP
ncbi:MAG TPA: FliM/FliN family flagellar motor switch protein [Gemmatimonadales bacterium]|jgi:flagellar motor switch protein FliM|nr:FliM/FliN family flagellar motor switch protein [Gemmatimonadales bacterium]